MNQIFRFPDAVKRDPAISVWMNEHSGELGSMARHWFDVIRDCGDDVRELLHDGHPTACIADAAFAYVNAFTNHVNVGFFRGAELADPVGLLEGTGKYMRHVKLMPGGGIDAAALTKLIESAYTDMKRRIGPARGGKAMTRIISAVSVVLFILAAADNKLAQSKPYTPAKGSLERKAILDGVREYRKAPKEVYTPTGFKVQNGWAFVSARDPGEPEVDTLAFSVLLRKTGKTWRVVGEIDYTEGSSWDSEIKRLRGKFPKAPAAIFQ